jgi:hypothetical protein
MLSHITFRDASLIIILLFFCSGDSAAQTGKSATKMPRIVNVFGLRTASALPANILPGTCDEWATQSTPIESGRVTCKFLGGNTNKCDRIEGIHAGTYNIAPQSAVGNVNVALLVNFEVLYFGMTDDPPPIYIFGKVNWGDNTEQSIAPWNTNVALTHVYKTQGSHTIRANFGKQLHFTSGNWSSSYEGCVDGTAGVVIGP